MKHTYKTSGTRSTEIEFDVEDNIVKSVRFIGGCNGNLKAIARLVEGQNIDWVIERLEGIKCGFKSTSCGDQFAQALKTLYSK